MRPHSRVFILGVAALAVSVFIVIGLLGTDEPRLDPSTAHAEVVHLAPSPDPGARGRASAAAPGERDAARPRREARGTDRNARAAARVAAAGAERSDAGFPDAAAGSREARTTAWT